MAINEQGQVIGISYKRDIKPDNDSLLNSTNPNSGSVPLGKRQNDRPGNVGRYVWISILDQ
jgi:hypothetical protein